MDTVATAIREAIGRAETYEIAFGWGFVLMIAGLLLAGIGAWHKAREEDQNRNNYWE